MTPSAPITGAPVSPLAGLDLLVCPACHRDLELGSTEALCGCGLRFAVEDDIPVLLVGRSEHAQRQADWFDEADVEWEIERPYGAPALHRWLLEEKFRRAVEDVDLPGATALTVCAGSGMDAEFLARAGARVIALDISPGAAGRATERARRHGFELITVVGDAASLPFRDASVDVVYVHDGLHHLDDPFSGLAEMARVARHAVCVSEPARARITMFAVRAGLAVEREEAGNRVGRLDAEAVSDVLREQGFSIRKSGRYGMYYRHEPGRLVRLFSHRRLFAATTVSFRLANAIAGSLGNKLTVVAVRP